MRDTIFALATGPGRSAVAIVRVSGPASKAMLERLCKKPPRPRMAALREIRDPAGDVIDKGLVLWFPGPASFTGEDVFELQLHGGPAIVEASLLALSTLGARPAEPGEFTRRAFEAGLLDLSQAEAVADLVDAETDAQRRQALAQLGRAISKRSETWREALLTALAFLEAQIDFPDEDVPELIAAQARGPLEQLKQDIDRALFSSKGERVRAGLKIALIGAPNAGKSSLLNALVGEETAIVTSEPGTTRDVIQAPLLICGHKVVLADTAGMRDAIDAIEAEGIRRAKVWADSADLRLWLVDVVEAPQIVELPPLMRTGDVLVLSKSDLSEIASPHLETLALGLGLVVVKISVVKAGGVDDLQGFMEQWVAQQLGGGDAPVITQIRHRQVLAEANTHLQRALTWPSDKAELIAEDIRLAFRSLEKLSGRLHPEDVLDKVFSTFCIGK